MVCGLFDSSGFMVAIVHVVLLGEGGCICGRIPVYLRHVCVASLDAAWGVGNCRIIVSFTRVYRVGVWSCFVRCTQTHGEGRISPATPRNRNNDQPRRGQPQEAAQT